MSLWREIDKSAKTFYYALQIKLSGKWTVPSFDHFGYPFNNGNYGYEREKHLGENLGLGKNSFSAGGDCWQQTGVHATYDIDFAAKSLRWMKEKYPEHSWRLVGVKLERIVMEVLVP